MLEILWIVSDFIQLAAFRNSDGILYWKSLLHTCTLRSISSAFTVHLSLTFMSNTRIRHHGRVPARYASLGNHGACSQAPPSDTCPTYFPLVFFRDGRRSWNAGDLPHIFQPAAANLPRLLSEGVPSLSANLLHAWNIKYSSSSSSSSSSRSTLVPLTKCGTITEEPQHSEIHTLHTLLGLQELQLIHLNWV